MRIRNSDRVVIVGPTGSGKSVLARELLRDRENVLVVDPKGDWKPQGDDRVAKSIDKLQSALNASRRDGRRVIYKVPRADLLPDNSAELDKVAQLALHRKQTLLYYDELSFVASGSDFHRRAPHYYFAVCTGRSQGVGVWSSIQRPRWVPMVSLTESDVRIAFYLRAYEDRQRMNAVLGDGVPWSTLQSEKYSFVAATDTALLPVSRISLQQKAS